MAIVSISKAAKMVRKGRQTLYNHNEKGKLSFTKDDEGKAGIDTSELERVYGKLYMPATEVETVGQGQDIVKLDTSRQVETVEKDSLDKGLQSEIDRIKELLDNEKTERSRERRQAEDLIEDLRKQRDKWEGQASAAMLRLEYQEQKDKTEQPKRRWFGLRKAAS